MNNFVTEQVIENAIMKELLYQTDLEGICTGMVDLAHKELIKELFNAFDEDALSLNELKPMEALYEFFMVLKEKYYKYIAYLDEHIEEIDHDKIKEIMVGIEVMFKNDLEGFLKFTDNVGYEEYQTLVGATKEQFVDLLKIREEQIQKVVIDGYIEHSYVDEMVRQNVMILFSETISQGNKLRDSYRMDINNIDKRLELKGYMNFLHKQDKTMAMLNLIQMEVINQEVSDPREQHILATLANKIKEIYQLIALKISETTSFLEDMKINALELEAIEVLVQDHVKKTMNKITKEVTYKEAIDYYLKRRNLLVKDLFISITDEIEKANDVCIKTLNKDSQDILLISCKITENIKKLDSNLRSLEQYLKDEDGFYNIIKGILDTVTLKLSALREKDYDYMLTKQNNIVRYEKELFAFSQEVKDKFEDYFHVMLDENKRIFFDKQSSYNKQFEGMETEAKQVDMDYLKYNLLFEVVTLEEIIHYSLPRLETYEQPICHQTISMVKKTYEDIQSLLKKFNVKVIDPEPGDRFNGKIHEVTVVNESETYHKGQIIGLVSKGYFYKNVPVVRAHVIVAK